METTANAILWENEVSNFIPEVLQSKTESASINVSDILDDSAKNNYFLVDSSVLNEQAPMSIRYDEVFQSRGEYVANELAGVYFQGVQYFDFRNVSFINNTGIANLLDILKSLLQQGIEIKFVNVMKTVKNKFDLLGLECIFNCS